MTKKVIEDALAEIEDSTGRLTAEQVVEAAKDDDSPLHECFEWDDTTAAHQHRLDQARTLIRSVRVKIRVSKKIVECVAYIRDPSAGSEQGYRNTREVAKDPDDSHEALAYAFSAAAAHLRRARDLAKVFKMEAQFDDLLESVNLLRSRLLEPPERRPT